MISPYHQQIADHYEKYPYPSYSLFGLGGWAQLQSVDLSTWPMEGSVRDVWIAGCGTIAPLMFGRRNPGVSFLATDLSSSALRRLRVRLWLHGIHNVRPIQEDIMLAHYVESFDAIDCYGVIHHTFSPQLALERLARALRPGGILRLMVYSREARKTIEDLRSEVLEKKIKSMREIKALITMKGVIPSGDLAHSAGIADALLNPIVQTYDEDSLHSLIDSQKLLKLVAIDSASNYIIWLKRQDT
jgi:SAM-dependent methyltransferase